MKCCECAHDWIEAKMTELLIYQSIVGGNLDTLNSILRDEPDIAHSKETHSGRPWLSVAISEGPIDCTLWFLDHGANVHYADDEGYPALIAALYREDDPPGSRAARITLLLEAGADPNDRGINDWTATHLAAFLDDVPSLRLLARFGADFTARTRIDDYATPYEEARLRGSLRACDWFARNYP